MRAVERSKVLSVATRKWLSICAEAVSGIPSGWQVRVTVGERNEFVPFSAVPKVPLLDLFPPVLTLEIKWLLFSIA